LTIGANESSTLYLLDHIERYRERYPKIKVQVRRSLSSKIPTELLDGELELGILTFDPEDDRLISQVIYTDHLAFIVSPSHRLAKRESVAIAELAGETFIAHNVVSPYRAVVIREFQRHKVPLNMDLEMPTIESIRKMVERNEGVAFLPRMCVEEEIRHGLLCEVKVKQLAVERKAALRAELERAQGEAVELEESLTALDAEVRRHRTVAADHKQLSLDLFSVEAEKRGRCERIRERRTLLAERLEAAVRRLGELDQRLADLARAAVEGEERRRALALELDEARASSSSRRSIPASFSCVAERRSSSAVRRS